MFLPSNITLKFGDSGDFVSELQRRLAAVKCFNESAVNGFFDGTTVNGVSMFQSMSGITADGVAGPETLRRLNGVISGDNGGGVNTQEEEERRRQEEMARQIAAQEAMAHAQRAEEERLAAERAAMAIPAQDWQHQPAPTQPPIQYVQEAAYTPQQHPQHQVQQQMMAAEAAQMQMQQQIALNQSQQFARAPEGIPQHQPMVAQPIDLQQQQLMQQQQQQQFQQAQAIPVQHTQQHQPAPVQVIAPQPAAAAAAQAAAQAALATQQGAAPQAQAETAAPQAEATTQKTGIAGRVQQAVHYVSEKFQQLAAHFESKLRPDALEAAKEAGMALARSGVKEVSVPTGPEPQRGVDTPARGPQQQQSQQRA